MFAKYISENQIIFPPKNLIKENGETIINFDLNEDALKEYGYKLFEPAEKDPELEYSITYNETNKKITEIATPLPIQTPEEKFIETKQLKIQEALQKAQDYEQNGTVEYKNCVFEMSISNRTNLKDTEEALIALGETSTQWNDKNDEIVELTLSDIQYIRLNLILARIKRLWIEQYPSYKQEIENAETLEQLESININYTEENNDIIN